MDTKINEKLYKRIEVWKRINEEKAVRYICFEVAGTNEYCVQSVDFFYYPITKSQLEQSDLRAIELFFDIPPEERAENIFPSLSEAIQAHDEEFR